MTLATLAARRRLQRRRDARRLAACQQRRRPGRARTCLADPAGGAGAGARGKAGVFYRIVGRVAARLSERLRVAAERIAGEKSATDRLDLCAPSTIRSANARCPTHAYYGVQTIRGMENFPLSGIPLMYHFEHFIRALRLREEGRRDGERRTRRARRREGRRDRESVRRDPRGQAARSVRRST